MGEVYLARHVFMDRPAAIKVLLPALSPNKDVVGRFFAEARATTSSWSSWTARASLPAWRGSGP
jgi:serine/threonine protein kinase